MILLLVIGTAGYLILLVILGIGLSRLGKSGNSDRPYVSVLVAARNEEANVGACVEALLAQDYPRDRVEIIVIDDASTDKTASIVQQYHATDSRVRLIQAGPNPEGLGPKKNAIRWGIASSKGDIIVTTDADCTPPRSWLSVIVPYFDEGIGVVAGPSILTADNNWLTGWLRLENLGNIAIYAGSIGLDFPVGAQGANLAYRRELWDALGFGESGKTFSGDDDLFVQRVAQDGRWRVRYAFESSATVPHRHHVTGRSTVGQKRRHLSVVRWYRPAIVVLAALVTAYHALLALSLVIGLFVFPTFLTWLLCTGVKTLGDGLILEKVAVRLEVKLPWHWLPVAEILRPFALLFLTPMSLVGQVSWKGRARSAAPASDPGKPT